MKSITLPSVGFPGILASVSTKSGMVIEGSLQVYIDLAMKEHHLEKFFFKEMIGSDHVTSLQVDTN